MMMDDWAVVIAVRNRLRSLQFAGTPATSLSSGGKTFVRATGSFVTEGYVPGMEVVPTGFGDNTRNVITAVDALSLSLRYTRPIEGAAGGRTLSVGIPVQRAWEGVSVSPDDKFWFLDEDYLAGPQERITGGVDSAEYDNLPVYVVKLEAISGSGVEAIYAVSKGILSAFRPSAQIPLSNGLIALVREIPAPYRGQVLASEAGRLQLSVTIPLRVRTFNS